MNFIKEKNKSKWRNIIRCYSKLRLAKPTVQDKRITEIYSADLETAEKAK